jgi:integrase
MAKRSADKPDFRAIDRLVRALPVPPTGQRTYKEPQLRALGLTGRWLTGLAPRITARGARIWTLGYRAHGIERRHTIGSIEAWSAEAAWHEAANLRRIVDQGGDPQRDRRAERTAPTIDDLADRFELEHMPRLRPGSQDEYRRLLRIHIRPALGRTRVAELRHADIDAMHRKIAKDAPYSANRAVAVVSKMLSLAIKWEWREGANPARGIERAQEHKRERFLTGSEIARLGAALDAHPETASANVVRLLLLTGARRGEVLSARWDQFDLSAATWVKPASVTKQRKTHRLPLSAPALQLLATMKAAADRENERRARYDLKPIPYLFPGKEGQALTTIKHFWAAIIRQADLPRLRVHDLRHTHASILASLGLSLPVIGRLLGHTQAATTARYAHLLDDPLRAATERAGAFLTEAGRDAAEVVPLLRKRFQK